MKRKIILLLLVEIIFIPLVIFFVSYILYHKVDFPSCHTGFFVKVSVFYGSCLTIISFVSFVLALIGIKYFEKSLIKYWIILSIVSFSVGIIIYFVSMSNAVNGGCPCGCLMN